MKRFTVELRCRYKEWWRYNVEMMCAAFDAADRRVGFSAARSHVADVGAELREPPAGVVVPTELHLDTEPCNHALLYLYIIPHTLPAENRIGETPPFEVTLRVGCDGRPLRTEQIRVNQWGGASIQLRLEQPA